MCSTVNPRKAFNPSSSSHFNALLPKRGTYCNESISPIGFFGERCAHFFGIWHKTCQNPKPEKYYNQQSTQHPTKNYMFNEVNKYDDHKIAAATQQTL